MKFTRRQKIGILVLAAFALGRIFVFRAHRPQGYGAPLTAKQVYYCPMHPSFTSDRPGDCAICGMKLRLKESQPRASDADDVCVMHNCPMMHEGGTCPMMVISKPGENVVCPICGTHVVEAQKPGEIRAQASSGVTVPEGYAPILLSPQKRQLIGITTAIAAKRAMTRVIRTAGKVAYDPELYQAQQEYLQARHALKDAQAHAPGGVSGAASPSRSQAAPAVVEQAHRLVAAAALRMKLLGFGEDLIQEMNDWEAPDSSLLLADPSGRVWVYAPIYQFELPLIKIGQKMSVEIPSVSGKLFEGTIRSLDPVLDSITRSARVRAVLTDPDHLLRPEMYVNSTIRVDLGQVVAIPEEAVFDTGTKKIVFVDRGEGLFEPREVTLGPKADGYYELKEGVTEGETVVTSGNFLIDSESRLKGVLQEGRTHHHGQ